MDDITSYLWSIRSNHAEIQFPPASNTEHFSLGYFSKIPDDIIEVKAAMTSMAKKAKKAEVVVEERPKVLHLALEWRFNNRHSTACSVLLRLARC